MAESDRCWPGYEPVKGKKPHEQGSCKPKAESKATPSEKKFQGKRKEQLEAWQKEHPKASKSAAQHLHAPGAKPKKAAKASSKKPAKRTASAKRKTPAKRAD